MSLLQFTHQGEVRIEAEVAPSEDMHIQHVLLHVIDTGIGVAEEYLSQIFEPFEQVDGSTTRKYGGTGLGLSIVRDIMNCHTDGRVTVKSTLGQGSVFTCRFRVATASDLAEEKLHLSATELTEAKDHLRKKEAKKRPRRFSLLSPMKQALLCSAQVDAARKRTMIPTSSELQNIIEILSVPFSLQPFIGSG